MSVGSRIAASLAAAVLLLVPLVARASMFAGEALDAIADWVAIIVLVVVPVVVLVVFWLIHILPEKIAEKRHHPQKDAINTLCLLSLFFGGLLWPVAWLWAYYAPGRLPNGVWHGQARRLLRRACRQGRRKASS